MERRVDAELGALRNGSTPPELDRVKAPLRAHYATLFTFTWAVVAHGSRSKIANDLGYQALGQQARLATLLNRASAKYATRADRATTESLVGSAAVIAALVAAFMLLYRRERTRLHEKSERRMLRKREAELRMLVSRARGDPAGPRAASCPHRGGCRARADPRRAGPARRADPAADRHRVPPRPLQPPRGTARLGRAQRHRGSGIRDQIAEVMAELRGLMVQLRPPVLDERGLAAGPARRRRPNTRRHGRAKSSTARSTKRAQARTRRPRPSSIASPTRLSRTSPSTHMRAMSTSRSHSRRRAAPHRGGRRQRLPGRGRDRPRSERIALRSRRHARANRKPARTSHDPLATRRGHEHPRRAPRTNAS